MIRIRISILLAFSLLPPVDDKKPKKGKKDKGKKKEKDKSSKSSKKSKKKEKEVKEKIVVEKPKYLFDVGPPIGYSHIEYELMPGRPKYQIDVICWGSIAKVFSADGEITLRTFVKDEMAWVPISLKHVLNQLEDSDIFKFYRHVINYTITTNKRKLGKRAKAEKSKVFYIREEEIDSESKFILAYTTNPNEPETTVENDQKANRLEEEIQNIIWECVDTPGKENYNEIVTRLEFISDPVHFYQVNKIIDRVHAGKVVESKDFVTIPPPPLTDKDLIKNADIRAKKKKKKGKGKKDKKKKDKSSAKSKKSKKDKKGKKGKKEKKGDGLLCIAIPGEVFYTDPTLNIYDLRTPSTLIKNAYILTTVTKLMHKAQKYSLNPLIIKIKKISNLPVELLANHRFNEIYAYYSIPYIARCSTIVKPLAKTIKFNEAHAHFTDLVPKLKFLEFMQTQRLYIEIRGVREEKSKKHKPNLFGMETEDKNIGSKLTTQECTQRLNYVNKQEPSTVTLAVACYDLSSLIKPTWDFKEKTSCHHPTTMLFQPAHSMYETLNFVDTITVNEVNLGVVFRQKSLSPLPEYALSDFHTTLKVEVYLSAPHNALLEVPRNGDGIYQRMFIVVNCEDVAVSLLNGIMLHNQYMLGPEVLLPNFLKVSPGEISQKEPRKSTISSAGASGTLTGFVVDNGSSYAFFLEGLANGFISDIWGQILDAHSTIMKIFYNSDFCFERRLYTEFIKFGGIYIINLKIPFEEIMRKRGIYFQGNVPAPCWEALKKLHLLLKCVTSRAMIQYCLFPTPLEFLSLDLEWGVPYYFNWKKEKQQENSTVAKEGSEDSLMERPNNTQLLLPSRVTII